MEKAGDEAVGAPVETGELAEGARRGDVEDIVEIVMVRQIDRIRSQAKLVVKLIAYERQPHMEVPIDLRIQREKGRIALPIRLSNIIVQHVQIGERKAGVHVHHGTESELPGKMGSAPENHSMLNIGGQNA